MSPPADQDSILAASPNRQVLQRDLAAYQHPDRRHSIGQLANTLIPYGALWYLGVRLVDYSFWLAFPVILLLSGFMVRTFIIFHDCGHGSFFKSRRANTFWGLLTGLLTFTPFHSWRAGHARHHSTSGNLDKRGQGDVWMMTLREYCEAPRSLRLKYRFYRNPWVMFLLGPLAIALINNRFPVSKANALERKSMYWTNLAIVLLAAAVILLAGWKAYVLVLSLAYYLGLIGGVWLFYVQHQFEGAYWRRSSEWDFITASLEGGSYYRLPGILRWFSGSIGYHHLHHLNARIPNYKLARCQQEVPALLNSPSIGVISSLQSLRFRLYDEEAGEMIGFRELRNRQVVGIPG